MSLSQEETGGVLMQRLLCRKEERAGWRCQSRAGAGGGGSAPGMGARWQRRLERWGGGSQEGATGGKKQGPGGTGAAGGNRDKAEGPGGCRENGPREVADQTTFQPGGHGNQGI